MGSLYCSKSPMPRTCRKRLLEAPLDQLTLGARPSSSSTWRAARLAADSLPSTVTLRGSSINEVPWKVAVTMISSSILSSAAAPGTGNARSRVAQSIGSDGNDGRIERFTGVS